MPRQLRASGGWPPTPGGPANIGGSFLAIPKNAADPEKAFEVIKWMLSPDNQAKAFADAQIFPSTPASYTMPQLTAAGPVLRRPGDDRRLRAAAEKIPVAYDSPSDGAVSAAVQRRAKNVEARARTRTTPGTTRSSKAKSIAERLGVSV